MVMNVNPSHFKGKSDSPNRPVENVSWNDAMEFCRRLSEKTGATVRLPTEAEWEYACRAGVTMPFHFGANLDLELANFKGTQRDQRTRQIIREDKRETTPMGTYPPNAWWLQDMHGNVQEWCSDWVANYPAGPALDPQGPKNGQQRIARGGAWDLDPSDCRSANRRMGEPGMRRTDLGFRVVVSFPPAQRAR